MVEESQSSVTVLGRDLSCIITALEKAKISSIRSGRNFSSITYKKHSYGIMRVIGITKEELLMCYLFGVDQCIDHLKSVDVYPHTIVDRKKEGGSPDPPLF